jgi:hypothetical protein
MWRRLPLPMLVLLLVLLPLLLLLVLLLLPPRLDVAITAVGVV